jgi:protein-tyrosine kinase
MNQEHIPTLGVDLDLPLVTLGLPSPGPVRPLGQILAERIDLPPTGVREILEHADELGIRFGDATVALGYASTEEVIQALSTQFQYPCAAASALLESSELAMLSRPHSAQAEALRGIRGQLLRSLGRACDEPRPLAVISPQSGDGKTFLVANLGVAFAQTGARTLIVEADMRGPRMHEVFNLHGRHGLSSALIGRSESLQIRAVPAVPGLYVLPCGVMPPNPIELLERPAFRTLMCALARHFDRVLVDTPAIASGADAFTVADCCGASLLVGRRHRSSMGELRRVARQLSQDAGRLAGMVVNDF